MNTKELLTILVYILSVAAGLLIAIICAGIYNAYHDKVPTALDVYRGNTALQIDYTSIDGEITKADTIVVFKNAKQ